MKKLMLTPGSSRAGGQTKGVDPYLLQSTAYLLLPHSSPPMPFFLCTQALGSSNEQTESSEVPLPLPT